MTRLKSRAAVLVGAGVLASAASYLFQMQVMAAEAPALFVRFNHWLFLAGVIGLPGVLTQSVSGFWHLSAQQRSRLLVASASVGSVVSIVLALIGPAGLSEWSLLLLHFVAFIPTCALMGQALALGYLPAILWGILCPVVARIGFYQVLSHNDLTACRAIVFTTALTVVGLSVLLARSPRSGDNVVDRPGARTLTRGAVLALVSSLIPYADFELIRLTQAAASVELFGRVSLLSRMVLLGGTVLTQAVLPEQLQHFHRKTVETRWWMRHAPILIFSAAVAASFALYLLVPLLRLPGFDSWTSDARKILLIAGINCAALVLVLAEVQAACTVGKLQRLWPGLAIFALSWIGICLTRPPSVVHALTLSGVAYAATATCLYVFQALARDRLAPGAA